MIIAWALAGVGACSFMSSGLLFYCSGSSTCPSSSFSWMACLLFLRKCSYTLSLTSPSIQLGNVYKSPAHLTYSRKSSMLALRSLYLKKLFYVCMFFLSGCVCVYTPTHTHTPTLTYIYMSMDKHCICACRGQKEGIGFPGRESTLGLLKEAASAVNH